MSKETEKPYGIRIDPELLNELRQLAKKDARSLNSELVWILRNYTETRQKEEKQKVTPNT